MHLCNQYNLQEGLLHLDFGAGFLTFFSTSIQCRFQRGTGQGADTYMPREQLSSSPSYTGWCPGQPLPADVSLQLAEAGGYYLLLNTLYRLLRETIKRIIIREVPLYSKDEKSENCTMIWMCLYFPLWFSLARMFSSDDSWAE